MGDTIAIRLRAAGACTTVRVRGTDALAVLRERAPALSRPVFLLGADVVFPGFTFDFLGVRDGAEVALVDGAPPRAPPPAARRAAMLPRLLAQFCDIGERLGERPDKERLHSAVQAIGDPFVSALAARIRDHSFDRIEGSFVSHLKMVTRFLAAREPRDAAPAQRPPYAQPPPAAPSSEKLPRLWGKRERRGRTRSSV
jgi:hypothetical protein